MRTEDELKEALEAVRLHGTISEASRNTGIPRKTLSDRYRAAKEKGIKSAPQKREESSRNKALEKLVIAQQARIETLQKKKFKAPKQGKAKKSGKFSIRAIIPDTHGVYVNNEAVAAMLSDLEQLNVKEAVLLGDHMDCGGFLAQHHVIGYVAEAEYTFDDDQGSANIFLDQVQDVCPDAEMHYLEGNHERRIEKWCVTQALANHKDAEYLRSLFSTSSVLSLPKRGINFYSQGEFYNGCRIPSTIKLGKCYFTHGSRTGKNPARAMLGDFGANVVFGHTHTADAASDRTVEGGEISAFCPGSLCRQQPLWMHTNPTNWTLGYAIQIVAEDGGFLHINVPIINGRSYLKPLVGNMI